MLSGLYIENLAVIEKADISFGDKLNVFTGETGAGKSILINGINAILGNRISREIVRTGAGKAVVKAVFCNITKACINMLDAIGIDAPDGEILISREISQDGRTISKINGQPVTNSALREITQNLIDIHGQHDSRILLSPETHIHILDNFGGLNEKLNEYAAVFKELQDTARRQKQLLMSEAERERRIYTLSEQIAEIENADIYENEEEELIKELELYKNYSSAFELLNSIYKYLEGTGEGEGAYFLTKSAFDDAERLSGFMDSVKAISSRLEVTAIELEDIKEEVLSSINGLEINPQRQNEIEERLTLIKKLQKKYQMTVFDLKNYCEKCKIELSELNENESQAEKLEAQKRQLLTKATSLAKLLSEERKKAAEIFVESVGKELKTLNMPDVRLEVKSEQGKLTLNGMDTIEFLISANVGEPPKAIAKIASGGELSRIMLALKSVLADKDDIPTLIFDEIDTGISGIAADKVGKKLHKIAAHRQILCVTHLAQIAVMADTHMLIKKSVSDGRTYTNVSELDFEGRKHEIARIMAGEKQSDLLLKNAEELLLNKNKGE